MHLHDLVTRHARQPHHGVPTRADAVGRQFADGSTLGDKDNIKRRFDSRFVEAIA